MLTLLLYVLIVGLVAALLFLVASAVFGRGEELGPLPEGTTVTVLPGTGIRGADVRALQFQQVFRGYKAGEVDWALSRLAARIDELEAQLAQRNRSAGGTDLPSFGPGPTQPGAGGSGDEPSGPATNATAIGSPGTIPDFPARSGFDGLPGAPGTTTPFVGHTPPFGTGFGGAPMSSAPTGAGNPPPPEPFATGNGFGPMTSGSASTGPALLDSASPAPDDSGTGAYGVPAAGPAPSAFGPTVPGTGGFAASLDPFTGRPATHITTPGAFSPAAPGTTPGAGNIAALPTASPAEPAPYTAPGPEVAPSPPAPGEAGHRDPAGTSPAAAPAPGFAPPAAVDTGSWAPPPLPSDPQPGPGGMR